MTQIPYKHRFQIGKHASQKLLKMNSRTRTISMALTSCFKVGPCQLDICLKKKVNFETRMGNYAQTPNNPWFLIVSIVFQKVFRIDPTEQLLEPPNLQDLILPDQTCFSQNGLEQIGFDLSFQSSHAYAPFGSFKPICMKVPTTNSRVEIKSPSKRYL